MKITDEWIIRKRHQWQYVSSGQKPFAGNMFKCRCKHCGAEVVANAPNYSACEHERKLLGIFPEDCREAFIQRIMEE